MNYTFPNKLPKVDQPGQMCLKSDILQLSPDYNMQIYFRVEKEGITVKEKKGFEAELYNQLSEQNQHIKKKREKYTKIYQSKYKSKIKKIT